MNKTFKNVSGITNTSRNIWNGRHGDSSLEKHGLERLTNCGHLLLLLWKQTWTTWPGVLSWQRRMFVFNHLLSEEAGNTELTVSIRIFFCRAAISFLSSCCAPCRNVSWFFSMSSMFWRNTTTLITCFTFKPLAGGFRWNTNSFHSKRRKFCSVFHLSG